MHKLRVGEIRRHISIYNKKTFDYKIISFKDGQRMGITIVDSKGPWRKGENYTDAIIDHENDKLISEEIVNTSEKFLSKSGEKIEAKVTKI